LKVSELFTKDRQYEVVAMLLERAAELDPHNQVLLYGLANAYDVTKRPRDAKQVRQRITDVNRHSDLGKNMMMRFLEEDPYVPLSMRENTLVALREAVGLMLPLALLIFLDNRLSFLGTERLMAVGFGFLGFYLVVTATSSHEQKIWQQLIPTGLTEALRYVLGAAGTLLVVVALYFALLTSIRNVDDFDTLEERGCRELMSGVPNVEEDYPDYDPHHACAWLYSLEPSYAAD
jgi:Tetratricopeptide repeat